MSFLRSSDGRVVEALPGLAQEERLGIEPGLLLVGELRQHGRLGRLQHAIEPAQHGEGQDDLAVVGLLVVAAQEIGDRPDEGGEGLMVQERPPQSKSAHRRRPNHDRTLSVSGEGGKSARQETPPGVAPCLPARDFACSAGRNC